ncbi:cytochrome P450 [Mycobacterium kansasii]|uniref:cytochrome P450 n=1 Tax=Mycobacterium kansasii TaxID=1768 RepID=UPI000F0275D4
MHSSDSDSKTRPNILTALMDSSHDTKLHDKPYDVHDETYTVLSAAADTTGNAMTTTLRYVLSNPTIYSLLHKELVVAFPDTEAALPFAVLERLPYLVSCCTRTSGSGSHTLQTGVIKEGLR